MIINILSLKSFPKKKSFLKLIQKVHFPETDPLQTKRYMIDYNLYFDPFQSIDAFQIEISHLICSTNQMTGFYMKCNTWLKWVKMSEEYLPSFAY